MRISTNMIFESTLNRMSDQQAALLKTQQQISAEKRILTPSDDPIAAARVLNLTQGQSVNTQYATNRQNAKDALSQEESTLDSVTSLIQDLQTQTVAAGNTAYDDTQRGYIAADLRSRLSELMGLANSRNSLGDYQFSGYQINTQPFVSSSSGVQYSGDQGQRMLQVGAARQMEVSDTGDAVFGNIDKFSTFTAVANTTLPSPATPSATVSGFSVVDSAALVAAPDTYNYKVTFTVPALPGKPTYTVADLAGNQVATGDYVSGEAIKFNGLQVVVSGNPAATDTVAISPSTPGKQSLFKTLNDLITVLETSSAGSAGKANLAQGLAVANGNLANALDNVLTVRSSVGSRLKELDSLDSIGSDRDIQYSDTISKLQDLDYYKAISDLSKQQTSLEAAQKVFVQTSKLSLFDLL